MPCVYFNSIVETVHAAFAAIIFFQAFQLGIGQPLWGLGFDSRRIPQLLRPGLYRAKRQYSGFHWVFAHRGRGLRDKNSFCLNIRVQSDPFLVQMQSDIVATDEKTEDQLAIFNKIEKEDLSVRKVEELVRELGKGKEKKEVSPTKEASAKNINAELQQLQSKLSSHFGTKVAVKGDEGNKGEIKIPFVSVEDLNRILDILNVHL